MKDQRGWKLKIGSVIPSTNTIVQPDFDDLRLEGITNHIARISIPNMDIKNDSDFDKMVRLSEGNLVAAVDRLQTSEPGIIIVGMSSLIVWDGYDSSIQRKKMLEERTGVPVTGGSFAVADALQRFGIKKIAILSPYMPIADKHITQFFTDSGFHIQKFVGLRCPSPVSISYVGTEEITSAIDEIDSPDTEAIVQFGTNLHFMQQAAIEEKKRGKPVISINAASYWHALRLSGIDTKYPNYGRLLAEF
ncbi:MAG: arylmalonate decarboxylase [Rhodospirillaceae bacterium]|nr:arylmalonate decarboxylase [Rhodospirillaceae bacterium]|tara:strand:+ start:184 stop:927 length:744 start_codon:yes stop_codon:yes gene_type:complete